MNLLLLGPACIQLADFFKTRGDVVIGSEEKVAEGNPNWIWMDYAVSFGYRHILPAVITRQYSGRILNIHISYLPWNRGADPNLWSFLEDTPKGVSVHLVDEKVDTGPLLAREKIEMLPEDTLEISYHRLKASAEALFMRVWPDYVSGKLKPRPQESGGTSHMRKDKDPWLPYLTHGWDTPTRRLKRLAVTR